MKSKIIMLIAALSVLTGCGCSHPAPKVTHAPTMTAQPFTSRPTPTCRPSNYANIPGTGTFGKKKCK